jgi:hypothetical protein
MKIHKALLAFALGSVLAVGLSFAADAKKDAAPASKTAGCCAKAAKDGKSCDHPCCVTSAKAGNNCEKCKGSGPIQAKK